MKRLYNTTRLLSIFTFLIFLGGVGCGGLNLDGLLDDLDDDTKTHIKGVISSTSLNSVLKGAKKAEIAPLLVKKISTPRELEFEYEYEYEYEYEHEYGYEDGGSYGYEYEYEYEYKYEYCGYDVFDEEDEIFIPPEPVGGGIEGTIVVFAMDAEGERTSAVVDEDGRFDLALTVGKSYVIGFSNGTEFLGVLTFTTDSVAGMAGSSIHISGAVDEIDLGVITFSNGLAYPENNPMEVEDHDADGVSDFDDEEFEFNTHYSCESEYIHERIYERGGWGDDDPDDDEDCGCGEDDENGEDWDDEEEGDEEE